MSETQKLKHAIVGVGAGVLGMHRKALELPAVHLVGVSDVNAEVGEARAAELGCPFFEDCEMLLAETSPDIVVILTPHPFHAKIAIVCLNAGAHVLVEKPMAVSVAEADAMIAAAHDNERHLAVNFQYRARPEVQAAKQLLERGDLGQLLHLDMTMAWSRTAVYYQGASWRATWQGEGGGILMNQAPHNLDLIGHFFGLPERVVAWTRTRLHPIETEDTAQAMLEFPDGTLGSLHVSTAEAGRPERLEIVGTAGTLQLGAGELKLQHIEPDFRTFVNESDDPFGKPELRLETLNLDTGAGDHVAVYQNLHDAILNGTELLADGRQGRMSLELANAMIYSSHTHSEVILPLDRNAYSGLLETLSKGESP